MISLRRIMPARQWHLGSSTQESLQTSRSSSC